MTPPERLGFGPPDDGHDEPAGQPRYRSDPAQDQLDFGLGDGLRDSVALRRAEAALRSRAVLAALGALAAVGLVVAVVGRLPLADRPARPAATSPAGLTENQAACFDFALAERRVAVVLGAPSPIGVGPQSGAMRDELRALDTLAARYDGADRRLIAAFAAVGHESARVLRVRGTPGAAVVGLDRYFAIRDAADECNLVGRFDIDEVEPVAQPAPE